MILKIKGTCYRLITLQRPPHATLFTNLAKLGKNKACCIVLSHPCIDNENLCNQLRMNWSQRHECGKN